MGISVGDGGGCKVVSRVKWGVKDSERLRIIGIGVDL